MNENITNEMLEGYIKDRQKDVEIINITDGNIKIEVKSSLNMIEEKELVDMVADSLFINEDYNNSFFQIIFDKSIFYFYTGIDMDLSTFEIFRNTKLFNSFILVLNDGMISYYKNLILDNVEYKKQLSIASKTKELEQAFAKLQEYTDILEMSLSGIDKNKIKDITSKLNKLEKSKDLQKDIKTEK